MNAINQKIEEDSGEVDAAFTESSQALQDFMELMEDTESPRQFLIWSLLSVSAALIGNNARFRSGPMHSVSANLYVILLGPPAVKKSSAINAAVSLAKRTSLNFGPTDTGGQRHGLMSALVGTQKKRRRYGTLGMERMHAILEHELYPRKSSDLFLVASELGRLLGAAAPEMADFLIDLWDGEPISYQTKSGEVVIREPLANLLGGTTPSSIASILPANAPDHGVLTRMLFVYGDAIHKLVPLPPEQGEEWFELQESLIRRLRWIDRNRLDFFFTKEAKATYEKLYPYIAKLEDPRMAPYRGRRGILLLKVAMNLAALRNDNAIIESDVALAHELLKSIEPTMHKALEYFGRSKTFQGRMLIVNYLKNVPGGLATQSELLSAASSELNQREAQEALTNLEASGIIKQYGTTGKYVLNQTVELEAN